MKTTIYLVLLILSLFNHQGLAQETDPSSNVLTLTISGIKEIKGSLFIAVFSTAEDYKKGAEAAVKKYKIPVESKSQTIIIKNIAHGTYGIKMFHDLNENDIHDINFLGIPKEPYGFSNNAKALFSAPDFEKTLFDFDAENTSTAIRLIH